jgi:hypothetical protein
VRGVALPTALLFAALGLSLGSAVRNAWAPAAIALLAGLACAWFPVRPEWTDGIYLACWSSAIVTAASVHLVGGPPRWLAVVLAMNAGIWAGAVAHLADSRTTLLLSLPSALVALPSAWAVRRRASIAIRIVASWIVAIAVLEAALQWLPVTPGYLPDHLE